MFLDTPDIFTYIYNYVRVVSVFNDISLAVET